MVGYSDVTCMFVSATICSNLDSGFFSIFSGFQDISTGKWLAGKINTHLAPIGYE